jgi:hypothetical protein
VQAQITPRTNGEPLAADAAGAELVEVEADVLAGADELFLLDPQAARPTMASAMHASVPIFLNLPPEAPTSGGATPAASRSRVTFIAPYVSLTPFVGLGCPD